MKLHMNTAILPLIQPGLYGTRLGDTYEWIDEDYNEDFKQALCEYGLDNMQEILNEDSIKNEIGLCEIKNVIFSSPTWYNYENDWFNFDLIIEDESVNQILFHVENIYNETFFDWIEKEYCSRSGFISFFPYTKEKYIKAIEGKDIERAVAMYIMFLIHISDIDLEQYQLDFEDDVQEEGNRNGWFYYDEEEED